MSQQFKAGDRVRVGPPVDADVADSHLYVREGAEGVFVKADIDGTSRVDFSGPESALLPFGSNPWWVDNRRLTLVDDKPVKPAAPLPIMARDMTLHDWFAGQALAGILAHPQSNELGIKGCIESAANAATAMMERRAK